MFIIAGNITLIEWSLRKMNQCFKIFCSTQYLLWDFHSILQAYQNFFVIKHSWSVLMLCFNILFQPPVRLLIGCVSVNRFIAVDEAAIFYHFLILLKQHSRKNCHLHSKYALFSSRCKRASASVELEVQHRRFQKWLQAHNLGINSIQKRTCLTYLSILTPFIPRTFAISWGSYSHQPFHAQQLILQTPLVQTCFIQHTWLSIKPRKL